MKFLPVSKSIFSVIKIHDKIQIHSDNLKLVIILYFYQFVKKII